MKLFPWNFTHIKRQPLKTIFPIKAFQTNLSHGDQSCELIFFSLLHYVVTKFIIMNI
jgi:hypothetical protein